MRVTRMPIGADRIVELAIRGFFEGDSRKSG